MTDLTEQWKKRTLPNGAYYIKLIGGDILPAFCNTEYILKQFQTMKGIYDGTDIQVLAPVPSYDDWMATRGTAQFLMDKNTQLKELLKLANKFLKDYGFTFDGKDCAEAFKVHTKINQALGEDK